MDLDVDLAALAIGALILLFALGLFLVAEVIARLIGSGVPFVGGAIGSAVRGAVGDVSRWVLTAYDSSVHSVAQFFAAVAMSAWHALFGASTAVESVGHTAQAALNMASGALADIGPAVADGQAAAVSIADGHADALTAGLTHSVLGWIAGAESQAASLAQGVANMASAGIAHAEADIVSLGVDVHSAVSNLAGQLSDLSHAVVGDVSSLEANIVAAIDVAAAQAMADAQAAEQTAIAAAATASSIAIGASERALDQAAHDVVIGPWQALLPALGGIAGALPEAVAGPLGIAGAMADAVPVSAAGVLGLVVPAVGAIAAEVDDCLVPNCRALGSLGQLFNGLESLGLDALLLALAAGAVTDPVGTAGAISSAAGWTTGAVGGLINAVVG